MRICTECQEIMTEGFVINQREYYCSDYCLHQQYSDQEFEEMYKDGGDTYWTQWDVSEYIDLPEIDLINAIKRTFERHRPELLPKQNFHSILSWITLYAETF
ncbi:MAG: hypothetical protein IJ085_06325 [Turicibacter sp.]|nr:hypothetical protein [Turicibacter sp.]